MSKFKNMKFEIREDQTLNNVVGELKNKGYKTNPIYWDNYQSTKVVCACDDGDLMDFRDATINSKFLDMYVLTTLTEIKEMQL